MQTIIEKNIAIAKMLGWKRIKHQLGYYYWVKPDDTKLPAFKPLLFHSDANWQFEAIDWIEQLNNPDWFYQFMMIEYNNISIRARSKKDATSDFEWLSVFVKGYCNWTRKEAIFEALYQFSQYLKQKI